MSETTESRRGAMIKASGSVGIIATWVDAASGQVDAEIEPAELIGIDSDGMFVCLVTDGDFVEARRVDRVYGEVTIDGRVVGGRA